MRLDPTITQTSEKGRKYRVTAVEQIEETKIFHKGLQKYTFHYIVNICFLDNDEVIRVWFDFNDKKYKKECLVKGKLKE